MFLSKFVGSQNENRGSTSNCERPGRSKWQTRAKADKQTALAQSGHCRNGKRRVDLRLWASVADSVFAVVGKLERKNGD